MGELASALTRRSGTGTLKTMAKAKAPPAAAAPAEDTPPKVLLFAFEFYLFCVTDLCAKTKRWNLHLLLLLLLLLLRVLL